MIVPDRPMPYQTGGAVSRFWLPGWNDDFRDGRMISGRLPRRIRSMAGNSAGTQSLETDRS
jgi:hypothetical protein